MVLKELILGADEMDTDEKGGRGRQASFRPFMNAVQNRQAGAIYLERATVDIFDRPIDLTAWKRNGSRMTC